MVTPWLLAPLRSLRLPPSPLAAAGYKHSPNALLSWGLAVVEVRSGSTELKERLLQERVWSEVWQVALCVCVALPYSAHWSKAQVVCLLSARAWPATNNVSMNKGKGRKVTQVSSVLEYKDVAVALSEPKL